jgi:hypothetical protein
MIELYGFHKKMKMRWAVPSEIIGSLQLFRDTPKRW